MRERGVILWQGQSDGAPIALIATGFNGSANRKTGAMVQTWIIRTDIDPVEAVKSGADSAICGNCVHRGTNGKARSCYVNVGQAPLSIYRAFKRGSYRQIAPHDVAKAFDGRKVRLGAYGDPAMVPVSVLHDIVRNADMWTGYTHQWRNNPELAGLLMASCDSAEEYRQARANGWRGFVVVAKDAQFPTGTVECMSTARGIECADCGACTGTRLGAKPNAVSIAIHAHGTGAKYVN